VLEPVRREVNAGRAPIQVPHIGDSKVELGELSGHALEANHELGRKLRLLEATHSIEGALPETHPFFAEWAQELQRRSFRVFTEQIPHPLPDRIRN
jgi:hypothetical protein